MNREICGTCGQELIGALTPCAEAISAGDGTLHGAIDHWQERATRLRGEANLLADILLDAYQVIQTIEAESTEEEESLWQLRYSIATALAPYKQIHKTTVESGAK